MKNCHFESYEEQPGDWRQKLVVDSGQVYVVCTSLGGSGTEVHLADAEHPWFAGANDFQEIFLTEKEVIANGYAL